MNQRKILILGTVAASLYSFRKDLILALLAKGYQVHALTTDSDPAELAKITMLGAVAEHYTFSRNGLNPLSDIVATYKLSKKIHSIKIPGIDDV